MVRKKKALRFNYKVVYSNRFSDDVSDLIRDIEDIIRNRFRRDHSVTAFLFENDSINPNTRDWIFIREYTATPHPTRENEVNMHKRDIKRKAERVR